MNKFYALLLLIFAMTYLTFGGVNAQTMEPEDTDLVSLGFKVLKYDDTSLIRPLLMTELRYKQLMNEIKAATSENIQDQLTDEQLDKLELEALESLDNSVKVINDILDKLGFNWDSATLTSTIVTKPRVKGEAGTVWIKYDSDDSRTRMDINYVIESEKNYAMITLDDVFKVGGKRYLARGYRFRAYTPSELNAVKNQRLISAYHLNTGIPKVDCEGS